MASHDILNQEALRQFSLAWPRRKNNANKIFVVNYMILEKYLRTNCWCLGKVKIDWTLGAKKFLLKKLELSCMMLIVSRKFDMLFWCRWIDKYFLQLFYFIRFLKFNRFHVEFSNITFRGRILLSHNAVKESCYLA
jgi:hypothetical protein